MFKPTLNGIAKLFGREYTDDEVAVQSNLQLREDDFSIQITSPTSLRFYVRLEPMKQSRGTCEFSDFVLEPTDDTNALEALTILEQHGHTFWDKTSVLFRDIYASYSETNDKLELVRRHDQLVSVVKQHAQTLGISVGDATLVPRLGKFDTKVLLR